MIGAQGDDRQGKIHSRGCSAMLGVHGRFVGTIAGSFAALAWQGATVGSAGACCSSPPAAPTALEQRGPGPNPGAPGVLGEVCGVVAVDCATGNETVSQVDLSVGGRGPGLILARTYNSLGALEATSPGTLGFGWTNPYSAHLELSKELGTVTVFQGNGSDIVFYLSGLGSKYAPASWAVASLAKEGSNFLYTLPNQSKLEFNSEGKLAKELDHNNNAITFTYTLGRLELATDGDSRMLTFKYTAGGLVESVKDPLGHTVKYTYESGNLLTVTLPGEASATWLFSYNSSHQLTKMTDGRSNATTIAYEGSHRVSLQLDPLNRKREFKYATSGSGSETKIAEPNGSETLEKFNLAGEPTKTTRALGSAVAATTEYEYNTLFMRTALIDPNKHTTKRGWSASDDNTSETDPTGDEVKRTYNGRHEVETETTPKGETTTIERDSHGNPLKIERPAPGGIKQLFKYKYNEKGDLTEATDPLEHVTKYAYDAAGDKENETDPEGDKRTWEYNADSQETAEVSPRGNVEKGEPSKYMTLIERDERGRPLKITNPLGHTTKYTYDRDGNVSTVTDGNSHTATNTYDADNKLTKVEEPNKTLVETGYDNEGRITSHTDGNKEKTEYKRNLLEEVTEETNPLSRKTKREYDTAGNLKLVEDPEKHTATYTYDESNRLKEVTYSTGKPSAVKYEYDKDSHIKKMNDETGETLYTYDELDRLTESKNGAGKVVKYEYNLGDLPTKITYPNEKLVTRTYDKANRLEKVTDWNNKETTFKYNPDSQLATTTFPAGTEDKDEYAYNEADQMTEAKMLKGATELGKLVYERDNDGQVKKTTTSLLPGPATSEDKYDENNRLTEDNKLAYGYDNANNPTMIEGTAGYAYDKADELEKGGGNTYTYNEDGQRTKAKPTTGLTTTYGYDQVGNLTSVERPEGEGKAKIEDTYTYDGNNLRQTQTINGAKTRLTWDTAEELPLVFEDETNSYIYGPGNIPIEQVSSGGTTLYLHHDQQGSTRLLTNTSGNTETAYTYDPYGTLNASTGTASTPLRYDGQYTDTDTGLIYLRARTYDPQTAQFLSIDPALGTTSESYTYAADNPLNASDRTGLATDGSCVLWSGNAPGVETNIQVCLVRAARNGEWRFTVTAGVSFGVNAELVEVGLLAWVRGLSLRSLFSAGVVNGYQWSSAQFVEELKGPFKYKQVSGGYIFTIGYEEFSDPMVWGRTYTAGLSAGFGWSDTEGTSETIVV